MQQANVLQLSGKGLQEASSTGALLRGARLRQPQAASSGMPGLRSPCACSGWLLTSSHSLSLSHRGAVVRLVEDNPELLGGILQHLTAVDVRRLRLACRSLAHCEPVLRCGTPPSHQGVCRALL